MEDIYTLNLTDYIDSRETALVGREHGENLLRIFKSKSILMKELESKYVVIKIIVPTFIVSINKSYFLGLFETRIQEIGSEGFRKKYQFEANEYILRKIDKNIDAALLSASQEEILGLGGSYE